MKPATRSTAIRDIGTEVRKDGTAWMFTGTRWTRICMDPNVVKLMWQSQEQHIESLKKNDEMSRAWRGQGRD